MYPALNEAYFIFRQLPRDYTPILPYCSVLQRALSFADTTTVYQGSGKIPLLCGSQGSFVRSCKELRRSFTYLSLYGERYPSLRPRTGARLLLLEVVTSVRKGRKQKWFSVAVIQWFVAVIVGLSRRL